MNIENTTGLSGSQPIKPVGAVNKAAKAYGATTPTAKTDEAQISERARLFQKLSEVPAVREERIEELKKLIEDGTYETEERIRGAVDSIIRESL
ncbi:MAG: flagellar biosynthesis anti-sigma factor FlgM [Planctomycetota bacterium]